MTRADQLVAFARQHRPEAPGAGDITDAKLIAELLTEILNDHIERHLPEGEPERMVPTPRGMERIPARPPAPWRPSTDMEDSDPTAWQLAMLLGHLQDALRKARAA